MPSIHRLVMIIYDLLTWFTSNICSQNVGIKTPDKMNTLFIVYFSSIVKQAIESVPGTNQY